jgi:hypothetical protein
MGIQTKYSILIKKIEGLSFEIDSDRNGQMVELNQEYISYELTEIEYKIIIKFKRPRSIINIEDTFILSESNNLLYIIYSRESSSVIPGMPNIIPDLIKSRFEFDHSSDQQLIFKNLLEKVLKLFGEHNYVDPNFKVALNVLKN